MRNAPSNTDDIIDSRDVIARIEELEEERDEYQERDLTEPLTLSWAQANPDEAEELLALTDLQEQAKGYTDWTHGATLVRDSYFETYAQDLAEEIGAINPDAAWPANCIDWDQAARELRMDYTSVEFDGVTYWVR